MQRTKNKKILLVGWDAADWQHITPMLDAGELPMLNRLIEEGVMGNLATLQPVLSPMLWNSIATGKTADKHGIHGFVEPNDTGDGVRPSTSTSRTTKAIWNIFNQVGMRSNVVGWWASYPAEPINGNIVTNLFNAIGRNQDNKPVVGKFVIHPESRALELGDFKIDIRELTTEDIKPFVPKLGKIDQTKDRRLATLAKVLSDCASYHAVTTHLMETQPWDFTAVYLDAIDHFCHAFMQYHPPRMPNTSEEDFEIYQQVIRSAYQFHDMTLQRLVDLAGPDCIVMLVSDHGFQSGRGRPLVTPLEPAGPAMWHRNYGVFLISGPGIKRDHRLYGASIIDVTPTLLHAAGLSVGEDMDGRVLLDAFIDPTPANTIASWDLVEGDSGMHPRGANVLAAVPQVEQDQLVKQFAALGYIDNPTDNHKKAAKDAAMELRYNLARVFYSTNRYDEAFAIFLELVRAVPWEDRFWKSFSYCAFELGHYAQALQTIRQLYPNWEKMPLFSKLISAQCLMHLGEREQADELITQMLAAQPRLANLIVTLGQTLVNRGRLQEAEAAFRRAIEIDADYPQAYEGLAGIHLRRGRNDEAIDASLTAVTLLYRLPKAHFYLALALERSGEFERAVEAYERLLKFNSPRFQYLAHRRLAEVYRTRLGNNSAADFHMTIRRQMRPAVAQLSRSKTSERTTLFDLPQVPTLQERSTASEDRRKAFKKPAPITEPSGKTLLIVSGLPRSGTSLMMQLLSAGGIEPKTDDLRIADINNPRGYLEWEDIKRLPKEPDLLDKEGLDEKAIKIISMLLPHLPRHHNYKVIFMTRPAEQVAASQSRMIERIQHAPAETEFQYMSQRLEQHRQRTLEMLREKENVEVLEVEYTQLVQSPREVIEMVRQFVGVDRLTDVASMQSVVKPELHRER